MTPRRHELADPVVEAERAAFRLVIHGTVGAQRPQLPPHGTDIGWSCIVFVHAPSGRIEWAAVATEHSG